MSVADEAWELEREDWVRRRTPRARRIELGLLCERCGSETRCAETRSGEMLCDLCAGR